MKKFLPIYILLLIFFIFKLANFGIRLSDTNIYFYTGHKLLAGQVLYKDIFFTNFPLLPYLSSLYYLLTAGNLNLFFLTSVIEVCAVAFLIYLIIYKKHKDILLSLTGSILYLFSFIILSTSDHQTGVFFASLVSVLSYYFYLNKRYLISGAFVSLALLTKAYFLPILLTFIAEFVLSRSWRGLLRFLIGAGAAGVVIMIPTLLFAFPDFVKDVLEYSLTRSQGVGKSNIVWFFITHDFVLFVLLLFSVASIKKNKFLGLLSFFGILFFIFYQDIYYLYLNFLIPFLVLSFPEFYRTLQKSFSAQKYVIVTVLFCFLLFGFITYLTGFRNLQKLHNFSEIVAAIKQENPKVIYGVNDITPALSYATKIPLLNGIIDTNSNIFRKSLLDSKKLTADAIEQKALIVAHGYSYPMEGVEESVVDEIFDKEQVKKSCRLVKSFPVQTEGPENRLNLLRCY